MIQRIQTVWLFLAAIIIACTLYFNVYTLPDGTKISLQNNYLAIVLIAVSSILSLVTIFNFRKRNLQLNLIWLNLLITVGLLGWIFYSINQVQVESTTNDGSYALGAFIPLISAVLLVMARIGIKKDIKILKAYDRLR